MVTSVSEPPFTAVPVGASLLAIAAGQLASVLDEPPSSRAGSLPQVSMRSHKSHTPEFSCGSGLAREGGISHRLDFPTKPLSPGESKVDAKMMALYHRATILMSLLHPS
jgi:hypothetical protein